MDSSVSPKDEIWFLRVCHHISNVVYDITRLVLRNVFSCAVFPLPTCYPSRAIHVEFEVHEVAMGQVSLRALGFSLSILSFHQCSILKFIHPASESNAVRNTNKTGDVRIMQQGGAFPQFLYFFDSPNSLIPFHSMTALLWRLNEHGNDTTYLTLRVKSLKFLPDCSQISIFSTNCVKVSNIKFDVHPSSWSRPYTFGEKALFARMRTWLRKVQPDDMDKNK
jgi:hypothetical protein